MAFLGGEGGDEKFMSFVAMVTSTHARRNVTHPSVIGVGCYGNRFFSCGAIQVFWAQICCHLAVKSAEIPIVVFNVAFESLSVVCFCDSHREKF